MKYKVAAIAIFLLIATGAWGYTVDQEQLEEWRNTVRYGIDSELSSVMDRLRENDSDQLNDALYERFQSTLSDSVKQEILRFYTDMEYSGAEEAARTIVEEFRQRPTELVLQAIRYLTQGVAEISQESRNAVRTLIQDASGRLATAAVRGLGRVGTEEDARYLVELLQQRTTVPDIRNEAILALGEMEYAGATEQLRELASDRDGSVTTRRYAIDSLGKIRDEAALSTLRELASSQNTQIRVQTTNALANFENEEVTELLISLLRDSNAIVRTEALKALADRSPRDDGTAAIRYKATNDPEASVQAEAMRTLVKIGEANAVAQVASDPDARGSARSRAITALAEAQDGIAAEALRQVIEEEIDATTPALTTQLARTLAQRSDLTDTIRPVLERLLEHPNRTVQLYALQAVARSELVSEYSSILTELAESSTAPAVRSAARQILPDTENGSGPENGSGENEQNGDGPADSEGGS